MEPGKVNTEEDFFQEVTMLQPNGPSCSLRVTFILSRTDWDMVSSLLSDLTRVIPLWPLAGQFHGMQVSGDQVLI